MANLAEVDTDAFIYIGGRVPENQQPQIIHVIVDASVTVIETEAFMECESLMSVKLHEGVFEIGMGAFSLCRSLRKINLTGVKIIDACAFYGCESLEDVDFGDNLETIGIAAFESCDSLNHMKIESVRSIGSDAFWGCKQLTVAKFGEKLETIGSGAFAHCTSLTHIAIPAKEGLFPDPIGVFENCPALATVEVVGGIHKTIASFHLEKWKNEMLKEIEKINGELPSASGDKTSLIINWMATISSLFTRYKTEHVKLVEEAMGMLNKAIFPWLEEENLTTDVDITPGENFVVDNVLPYLQLN